MIYLASPYSHINRRTQHERYLAVRAVVALLLPRNPTRPIFSPIVYAHEMAQEHGMATDARTWQLFNTHLLRKADELWVLTLPGWKESVGVQQELELACAAFIPYKFLDESGAFIL